MVDPILSPLNHGSWTDLPMINRDSRSGAQEHGAQSNGDNCEIETRVKNRGLVISNPETPFSLFVKQVLWDAFAHDFECRMMSVVQIAV